MQPGQLGQHRLPETLLLLVVRARAEQVGDPGEAGQAVAQLVVALGGQILRPPEVDAPRPTAPPAARTAASAPPHRPRDEPGQREEHHDRPDQPQRGEDRVPDRRARRRPVELGDRDHGETQPEPQPRPAAAAVALDDVADRDRQSTPAAPATTSKAITALLGTAVSGTAEARVASRAPTTVSIHGTAGDEPLRRPQRQPRAAAARRRRRTTRISSRRGVSPLAASALTGTHQTTPYSANAAATHDQRGSSHIRPVISARIAAPAVAVAVATVSTRTRRTGRSEPAHDGERQARAAAQHRDARPRCR